MKRSVFRWLRKKAEPYFGEAIIRGVDYLRKAGLPERVIEKITDGSLNIAPKLVKRLEDMLYRPAIIDRNPETVNPTFDAPPLTRTSSINPTFDAPPVKKMTVRRKTTTKFDERRHALVDRMKDDKKYTNTKVVNLAKTKRKNQQVIS